MIFGFAGAMGNVEFDAYLAARAPDMIARVTSIDRLMSFTASAVGPALGGILAQEFTYEMAALAVRLVRAARRCRPNLRNRYPGAAADISDFGPDRISCEWY